MRVERARKSRRRVRARVVPRDDGQGAVRRRRESRSAKAVRPCTTPWNAPSSKARRRRSCAPSSRAARRLSVPDAHGRSALAAAAGGGRAALVRELLGGARRGAHCLGKLIVGPLQEAARAGDAKTLSELCAARLFDIDAREVGGERDTALTAAARRASADCVRVLLAHGADPLREDGRRRSPVAACVGGASVDGSKTLGSPSRRRGTATPSGGAPTFLKGRCVVPRRTKASRCAVRLPSRASSKPPPRPRRARPPAPPRPARRASTAARPRPPDSRRDRERLFGLRRRGDLGVGSRVLEVQISISEEVRDARGVTAMDKPATRLRASAASTVSRDAAGAVWASRTASSGIAKDTKPSSAPRPSTLAGPAYGRAASYEAINASRTSTAAPNSAPSPSRSLIARVLTFHAL